jgi:hypothetical protein
MASSFGALESAIFQQPPIPVSSRRHSGSRQWVYAPHISPAHMSIAFQQRRNAIELDYYQHLQVGGLLAAWENLSPLISGYFEQIPADLVADSLSGVEKHYIITEGREQVARLFFLHRGLPKLLLDAVQPLRESFGEKLLQLQANSDGEDVSLRATILWPDSAESAHAALDNFDQRWWLDNCNRAHGYLVFDYELVDGL